MRREYSFKFLHLLTTGLLVLGLVLSCGDPEKEDEQTGIDPTEDTGSEETEEPAEAEETEEIVADGVRLLRVSKEQPSLAECPTNGGEIIYSGKELPGTKNGVLDDREIDEKEVRCFTFGLYEIDSVPTKLVNMASVSNVYDPKKELFNKDNRSLFIAGFSQTIVSGDSTVATPLMREQSNLLISKVKNPGTKKQLWSMQGIENKEDNIRNPAIFGIRAFYPAGDTLYFRSLINHDTQLNHHATDGMQKYNILYAIKGGANKANFQVGFPCSNVITGDETLCKTKTPTDNTNLRALLHSTATIDTNNFLTVGNKIFMESQYETDKYSVMTNLGSDNEFKTFDPSDTKYYKESETIKGLDGPIVDRIALATGLDGGSNRGLKLAQNNDSDGGDPVSYSTFDKENMMSLSPDKKSIYLVDNFAKIYPSSSDTQRVSALLKFDVATQKYNAVIVMTADTTLDSSCGAPTGDPGATDNCFAGREIGDLALNARAVGSKDSLFFGDVVAGNKGAFVIRRIPRPKFDVNGVSNSRSALLYVDNYGDAKPVTKSGVNITSRDSIYVNTSIKDDIFMVLSSDSNKIFKIKEGEDDLTSICDFTLANLETADNYLFNVAGELHFIAEYGANTDGFDTAKRQLFKYNGTSCSVVSGYGPTKEQVELSQFDKYGLLKTGLEGSVTNPNSIGFIASGSPTRTYENLLPDPVVWNNRMLFLMDTGVQYKDATDSTKIGQEIFMTNGETGGASLFTGEELSPYRKAEEMGAAADPNCKVARADPATATSADNCDVYIGKIDAKGNNVFLAGAMGKTKGTGKDRAMWGEKKVTVQVYAVDGVDEENSKKYKKDSTGKWVLK